MEWSKLKPRERSAVMLLAAAAFFGLYMRFIERPVSGKVAGYKSQIRQSELQLRDLDTKRPQDNVISQKIKDLEAEETELAKNVVELEKKMPSQFNTSELVGQITRLAKEVKLESVNQRISKELRRFDSVKASASSVSIAETSASSALVRISTPAADSRRSASCTLALAASLAGDFPA